MALSKHLGHIIKSLWLGNTWVLYTLLSHASFSLEMNSIRIIISLGFKVLEFMIMVAIVVYCMSVVTDAFISSLLNIKTKSRLR